MPESMDMAKLVPPGVASCKEPSLSSSAENERSKTPVRPVSIVLILLLPCLALTFYYALRLFRWVKVDSFLPSTGYAFVLSGQSDLIGPCRSDVVCCPAISSRPILNDGIVSSDQGFVRSWSPPSSDFHSTPTVLLGLVASGLVNKAVDVWFNDQIVNMS